MTDLSVYGKQRTLSDYMNVNRDRAMQQQQFAQQQQAGQLDLQSKKNIYATQVLSAAAASGDQNAYNQGLAHLQQNGIDTSNWAPDVQTGAQQAQAARLAQSPLGSLLNAGLKAESNGIAATNAMGGIGAGAALDPLSTALSGQVGGLFKPPAFPQSSPNPSQQGPIQPALNVIQQGSTSLNTKGFVPPQRDPQETQAAYKDRVQNAFEAYKANPDYIATAEGAKALGSAGGDEAKMLDIMKSGLPLMLKRFQNMRSATNDASSGLGVDTEGGGLYPHIANSMFGSQKTADANAMLKQNSSQNILGELGPQLSQAGVRGNKFLETIAQQASGMDMSAPPQTKQNLVNGLEDTYVSNLKSVANQVRLKGLPAPTDAEIDQMVAQAKAIQPKTTNWTIQNGRLIPQ